MFTLPTNNITLQPEPKGSRRILLTPLGDGDYLFVIDNSSTDKIKRCHTAAYNYLVLGREAYAKDAALTFGGACHIGIEKYLRGASDEAQVKAIVNYFAENPTPPDEYRTPGCAVEVLGHYRQRSTMPDYQWEILSDGEGLLIERPFELPLGVLEVNTEVILPGDSQPTFVKNIHVAWSGRMDVIANVNGMARVVDHKTSKIGGEQFIESFRLSSQTIGYVWAAQQLWPALGVAGFCLNCIELKKPGKGQGLLDKGPRGGAAPLSFYRAFYEYSAERVAQWQHQAMLHIEDFIHSLIRGQFPMNDKQCFDKYGKCPYFDSCLIDDPTIRQRLLLSDIFRKVTWNPVADR